jgi:3-methylfumaryl-CoA hydratase
VIAMSGVLAKSLADWQPGTAELTRRVDPWPAAAFAALTELPLPTPGPGDALPPLWHWFTLLDHPAHSQTGADGHPASGPFLPPIPGRRRMFAGGRLTLDAPIRIGAELTRRSAVSAVSVKNGRSGELAFVTVRHQLSVDGTAVGVEEQDIVYRAEPEGSVQHSVPRPGTGEPEPAGEWRLELATGPVQLFRFSALTYNGHRIHYDRPYAIKAEGYPDLVVHGPLLALLALDLPRVYAPGRAVREFQYRLLRPAFSPARIVAAGSPADGGGAVQVTVAAAGAAPSLTGQIVLG